MATRTSRSARAVSRAVGLVACWMILVARPTCRAADELPPPAGERFIVGANSFLVGQGADWLDRDHVVWHGLADDGAGGAENQIFRSTLDGDEQVCLTCGLDGPNQVPVVQPRGGKWILFHSWNGHTATIGSPGFGGIGSDVWVMRRNGRQRTNLTRGAELEDHFHAYSVQGTACGGSDPGREPRLDSLTVIGRYESSGGEVDRVRGNRWRGREEPPLAPPW